MVFMLRRNLALVALLVVTLALCINAYTVIQNRDSQVRTCQQVESLKSVVRQVLAQSAESLGRKGTAGFSYYRTHPEELAAAKLSIESEIADFKARRC